MWMWVVVVYLVVSNWYLVCVDIDRDETEKFAQAVAGLATEREVQSNFKDFQVGSFK